jgi:Spy/CpxP family protein refolding chaperone
MRKSIPWLLFCLFTALPIDAALAQGVLKDMPGGKWWTNKSVINQLNLSPDQRSKIEDVWMQSRRNLIDQQAEMGKRQLDLEEIVGKDQIDEKAALKALESLQEARANLEQSTMLMRIRIKNLLTPDQQQKLQAVAEALRQQRARANGVAAQKQASPPVKK